MHAFLLRLRWIKDTFVWRTIWEVLSGLVIEKPALDEKQHEMVDKIGVKRLKTAPKVRVSPRLPSAMLFSV